MLYLIIYLLLEPVKRVASALLYPLAYALRRQLRTGEVMRPEYLYRPTFAPLWLLLDDSIKMETGEECARQENKYPAWVNALGWNWLKCYWWSAIRNSFVNWNNWAAFKLGRFVSEEPHTGRNFYITRAFEGGKRPYCEFWLFGRWNQVGWLNGQSPRFEIDVMKNRSAK